MLSIFFLIIFLLSSRLSGLSSGGVEVSADGSLESKSQPPPLNPLVLSIPIRVDAVDTNFELREGDDPTTSLAAFIDLHDLGDDHSHQLWDTVRKATLLQGRTPMVRRVVVNCRAGRLMNCLMKAMCYVDKETKYDIAFIAEIDAYKAVCSARKTVKAMGFPHTTLSFFPSTPYESDPDNIPLASILSLVRKSTIPSVIVYIPKSASAKCHPKFAPVTQHGVQVDLFLQYARMQFAAYGNTSTPLLVTVGDEGVVVTGSQEGDRRTVAMYGPGDEEVQGGWQKFQGGLGVTVMLVEPDAEEGTSYAVFSDVIGTLMTSLSNLGMSPSLLRCPVFSQGDCSREALYKRAEGNRKVIVLAPHLFSRVTLQHNDFPVLLADPTILPEGTVLYNFEHVKAASVEGGVGGLLDGDILKLYGNDRFEVWDYSHSNVLTLSNDYKIEAKLVPLGHQRTIEGEQEREKDVGVLFYGTVTPYRREIINQLRGAGVEVTVVTDSTWGLYFSALDDIISRSSIVLVLNAFGGEGEWKITRLSKLLGMGKFVICERNGVKEEEGFEGEGRPGIVFAEKKDIVEVLKEWLKKGEQERSKVGERGKQIYEEQGGMEEALKSTMMEGEKG